MRGDVSAGSLSSAINVALPVTSVTVDGVKRSVLIDTGCSVSIVHMSCCLRWSEKKVDLLTINGERQQCVGVGQVNVSTQDGISTDTDVLVVKFRPLNFDLILGMIGIAAVGGVTLKSSCDVHLGPKSVCGAMISGITKN